MPIEIMNQQKQYAVTVLGQWYKDGQRLKYVLSATAIYSRALDYAFVVHLFVSHA